ncbi:MAG: glutamine--tRNA ligase, partial [Clostridia bacterium]
FVDRDDFIDFNDPKFYRLQVGGEVRLKGAYIVKCTGFDRDASGQVSKIYAEVEFDTKSGSGSTKKVKGTIHWLPASESRKCTINIYENLIDENFDGKIVETTDFDSQINTNSHKIITNALVEKNVDFNLDERYQFLRKGYFCVDSVLSTKENLVFNEVIDLKSSK